MQRAAASLLMEAFDFSPSETKAIAQRVTRHERQETKLSNACKAVSWEHAHKVSVSASKAKVETLKEYRQRASAEFMAML